MINALKVYFQSNSGAIYFSMCFSTPNLNSFVYSKKKMCSLKTSTNIVKIINWLDFWYEIRTFFFINQLAKQQPYHFSCVKHLTKYCIC